MLSVSGLEMCTVYLSRTGSRLDALLIRYGDVYGDWHGGGGGNLGFDGSRLDVLCIRYGDLYGLFI